LLVVTDGAKGLYAAADAVFEILTDGERHARLSRNARTAAGLCSRDTERRKLHAFISEILSR